VPRGTAILAMSMMCKPCGRGHARLREAAALECGSLPVQSPSKGYRFLQASLRPYGHWTSPPKDPSIHLSDHLRPAALFSALSVASSRCQRGMPDESTTSRLRSQQLGLVSRLIQVVEGNTVAVGEGSDFVSKGDIQARRHFPLDQSGNTTVEGLC